MENPFENPEIAHAKRVESDKKWQKITNAKNALSNIRKQHESLANADPEQMKVAVEIYRQLIDAIRQWEQEGWYTLSDIGTSEEELSSFTQ